MGSISSASATHSNALVEKTFGAGLLGGVHRDPVGTVLGPATGLCDLLAVAQGSDTGWWLS